jgi:pimeloyl-ACP methyl ester carboxylesterase
MFFALKYPQCLKGIVLIATGAKLRVSPENLAELEEALKGKLGVWVRRMREHYAGLDAEERETLVHKHLEIGPLAQLNDLLCCDRFDLMNRVHEIAVPALVVGGDEDVMIPLKFTDYLAAQIPAAERVMIEGATHHLFLEKPEEFNRAVSDFVSGLAK